MNRYLSILFTIFLFSINLTAQNPPPPAPPPPAKITGDKAAPPPPPPPPLIYSAPDKSLMTKFASETFGFKAEFPGQPAVSESKDEDSATTVFQVKLKGSNETVEITDFNFDVEKTLGKAGVFEQVREKYLSGETSELVYEKQIEQNGLEGKEFGFKVFGYFRRARVFVKNNRIYELTADVVNWSVIKGGEKEKAFNDEAGRFFDSFIIEKLPATVSSETVKAEKVEIFKSKKNIFESKDGGFRVYLPGKPELQKTRIPAGFGQADFFIYTLPTLSAYYAVTYFDYPAIIHDQTEVRYISDAQRDLLMGKGYELVSEKDLSYRGNYGREYVLTNDGRTVVMRNFFVNQRFFRLMAITRGIKGKMPEIFEKQNRDITYRFLDSFEPTKLPPPAFAEVKMPEDFGVRIENSVFYSDFFGFSMTAPKDWELFNKDEAAALKILSRQYLELENKESDLNMEKSFENTEFLFAMAKGGGENAEKMKILIVAAEKMSVPNFLPEAAVDAYIRSFLEPDDEVVGGVNKVKFDGVDFAYVETLNKKDKTRSRIYFANLKNLAFEITFTYDTDEDLKEIQKILETIKIKK